jgi:hypothetical protein
MTEPTLTRPHDPLEWGRLHRHAAACLRQIQPEFDAWRERFLKRIHGDPTARDAWRALSDCNADRRALVFLFRWADPEGYFPEMRRKAELLANRLERVHRADAVLMQRENDPRRAMFVARAQAALMELLETRWPFAWPEDYRNLEDVATFGDAVRVNPALGNLSAEELRRRGRVLDGRVFLYLLRLYASERGLTLGVDRILALAKCARNAGRAPSRAALKRCFAEMESCQEVIESLRASLRF